MDVPVTSAAAIPARCLPSPRAVNFGLSMPSLLALFARFHPAFRLCFSPSSALSFRIDHRNRYHHPLQSPSRGCQALAISNRHNPELELPVTYRKQRVASFLIATFRTLFRVAALAPKSFAHGFLQFLQLSATLRCPNRFGLAARHSAVTMRI
jgi:hypothetical protein